jgi:succinate dehydrogenase / fumarate reductase, cytochrome b subunit
MSNTHRPTSPHLTIYRPQMSSMMSIAHRITGVALFIGTALIVTWLWSAAYAPVFYNILHNALASGLGKFCLLGWTVAFYYHLGNGIRHLFWDMGKGFTLPVFHRTGWAVLFFTLLMTAFTWGAAYSTGVQ